MSMELIKNSLSSGKTNFVLIGEAGCGKTEIAVNLAKYLAKNTDRPVHLFDMDMTKPLFRSRDLLGDKEFENIIIHYEEQFYDAPTIVGGVRQLLNDPDCYVVMDVGGDDIGARAIGGFMLGVDKTTLNVMYVLNYYRPFCQDIMHIDQFLSEILAVSRLKIEDVHFIDNPAMGISTTAEETLIGAEKMNELISDYREIEMICVRDDLYNAVRKSIPEEKLMPIHLYLTYEWLQE